MSFLSSKASILVINNIFKGKEALVGIDNCKKTSKSSSRHCNSKKMLHTTKCFVKYSFFLHKFISRQF